MTVLLRGIHSSFLQGALVAAGAVWVGVGAAGGQQETASAAFSTRKMVREVLKDFAGRGPRISLDGQYLAYVGTDNAIHVRELPTGADRRLTAVPTDTSRPNGRLTFSPDGKMIAWGWQEQPGGHPQLRVVSVDGASLSIPYNGEQWPGVGPWGNWSADGKQILTLAIRVPRSDPHTRQIALVSVADGSIRSVKTLPWEADPVGLSLSPDGRFIVYDYPVGQGAADRDIFMLPADGAGEVQLVAGTADDRQPFFSPDGRAVVFVRQRSSNPGNLGAWLVPVANGKAVGVPELVNPDLGPSDTPIGFTQNGSFYYRRGAAIMMMERFLPSAASR